MLTAEERVDQAIAKVKKGQKFTAQQEEWLQYVRDHLLRNLVIEHQDFNYIPFSRHGGWQVANKVFEGKLEPLLETINLEMVTI